MAERGRGGTSPNPCVGAVLVRGTRTLGEGFHRAKGSAHAEVEALHGAAAAGHDVRGATAYVSLEPCNHHGATPPCSEALIAAGIARVVAGTLDPNPRTAHGGVDRLRGAGIEVEVAGDPSAALLVEDFGVAIAAGRPYVRLKMAASLDGYVAPEPGRHQLTGGLAQAFVRDLRGAYDAVLVGAGTVRTDDPLLTVRPPRSRSLPFRRVVACGRTPPPAASRIFAQIEGYVPTIVLAPGHAREAFAILEGIAEVVYVPAAREDGTTGGRLESAVPGGRLGSAVSGGRLDLTAALRALRARGISSLLCEGGPRLAAALLGAGLVDRLDWLSAPVLLAGPRAVPSLEPASGVHSIQGLEREAGLRTQIRPDRVERLGDDLLVSGRVERD